MKTEKTELYASFQKVPIEKVPIGENKKGQKSLFFLFSQLNPFVIFMISLKQPKSVMRYCII